MKGAKEDFSFGKMAPTFRRHIEASIPGYKSLLKDCVRHSLRFVQPNTNVYDVGCTDGHLLARVRRAINKARPGIKYIGIDCEPSFDVHWNRHRGNNISFEVCDARLHDYANSSLIFCLFTVQFIRPMDKLRLMERLYGGLVDGGALVIVEKTFAETARLQDALTSPHYDHKREMGFTAEEILDKERCLRGQMTLWDEAELRSGLKRAGFREMTAFWRSAQFVGYIALRSDVASAGGLGDPAAP